MDQRLGSTPGRLASSERLNAIHQSRRCYEGSTYSVLNFVESAVSYGLSERGRLDERKRNEFLAGLRADIVVQA